MSSTTNSAAIGAWKPSPPVSPVTASPRRFFPAAVFDDDVDRPRPKKAVPSSIFSTTPLPTVQRVFSPTELAGTAHDQSDVNVHRFPVSPASPREPTAPSVIRTDGQNGASINFPVSASAAAAAGAANDSCAATNNAAAVPSSLVLPLTSSLRSAQPKPDGTVGAAFAAAGQRAATSAGQSRRRTRDITQQLLLQKQHNINSGNSVSVEANSCLEASSGFPVGKETMGVSFLGVAAETPKARRLSMDVAPQMPSVLCGTSVHSTLGFSMFGPTGLALLRARDSEASALQGSAGQSGTVAHLLASRSGVLPDRTPPLAFVAAASRLAAGCDAAASVAGETDAAFHTSRAAFSLLHLEAEESNAGRSVVTRPPVSAHAPPPQPLTRPQRLSVTAGEERRGRQESITAATAAAPLRRPTVANASTNASEMLQVLGESACYSAEAGHSAIGALRAGTKSAGPRGRRSKSVTMGGSLTSVAAGPCANGSVNGQYGVSLLLDGTLLQSRSGHSASSITGTSRSGTSGGSLSTETHTWMTNDSSSNSRSAFFASNAAAAAATMAAAAAAWSLTQASSAVRPAVSAQLIAEVLRASAAEQARSVSGADNTTSTTSSGRGNSKRCGSVSRLRSRRRSSVGSSSRHSTAPAVATASVSTVSSKEPSDCTAATASVTATQEGSCISVATEAANSDVDDAAAAAAVSRVPFESSCPRIDLQSTVDAPAGSNADGTPRRSAVTPTGSATSAAAAVGAPRSPASPTPEGGVAAAALPVPPSSTAFVSFIASPTSAMSESFPAAVSAAAAAPAHRDDGESEGPHRNTVRWLTKQTPSFHSASIGSLRSSLLVRPGPLNGRSGSMANSNHCCPNYNPHAASVCSPGGSHCHPHPHHTHSQPADDRCGSPRSNSIHSFPYSGGHAWTAEASVDAPLDLCGTVTLSAPTTGDSVGTGKGYSSPLDSDDSCSAVDASHIVGGYSGLNPRLPADRLHLLGSFSRSRFSVSGGAGQRSSIIGGCASPRMSSVAFAPFTSTTNSTAPRTTTTAAAATAAAAAAAAAAATKTTTTTTTLISSITCTTTTTTTSAGPDGALASAAAAAAAAAAGNANTTTTVTTTAVSSVTCSAVRIIAAQKAAQGQTLMTDAVLRDAAQPVDGLLEDPDAPPFAKAALRRFRENDAAPCPAAAAAAAAAAAGRAAALKSEASAADVAAASFVVSTAAVQSFCTTHSFMAEARCCNRSAVQTPASPSPAPTPGPTLSTALVSRARPAGQWEEEAKKTALQQLATGSDANPLKRQLLALPGPAVEALTACEIHLPTVSRKGKGFARRKRFLAQ